MHHTNEMYEVESKQKTLILLCLGVAIIIGLTSTTYSGFASTENKTLMQPQGIQDMATKLRISF